MDQALDGFVGCVGNLIDAKDKFRVYMMALKRLPTPTGVNDLGV
jgi:hypothetical protein